jgi:hypothetical protein
VCDQSLARLETPRKAGEDEALSGLSDGWTFKWLRCSQCTRELEEQIRQPPMSAPEQCLQGGKGDWMGAVEGRFVVELREAGFQIVSLTKQKRLKTHKFCENTLSLLSG